MSRVIYSPQSRSDLAEIVLFISRDKPDAARKWRLKLEETCNLLATRPKIGQRHREIKTPGCRAFSIGNYMIVYREIDHGIEVVRVAHGSVDFRRL